MDPGYWHLIIYVDSNPTPQHVTIDPPRDTDELIAAVADIISGVVLHVTYWSPEQNGYLPLVSLAPIISHAGRAQLWVQSDGMRLEPMDPVHDEVELRQLMRHVSALNTDHITHQLLEAHRVAFPRLEHQFYERLKRLLDPTAETSMMWYSGNANRSSEAVQRGFAAPLDGSGITFYSAPDAIRGQQKLLLCEVAVGRSVTTAGSRSAQADSLATNKGGRRTVTVFDAHQAIPRYIMTIKSSSGQTSLPGSRTTSPVRERSGIVVERPPKSSAPVTPAGSPIRREATTLSNNTSLRPVTPSFANQMHECPAHRGETTTLWCSTCGLLVCPYCLSVGQHRGHDGRELDEIVTSVRGTLSEAVTTITDRHEAAQRTMSIIQAGQRDVDDKKRHGEDTISSAFADLESLMAKRRGELQAELRIVADQNSAQLGQLQQYMALCTSKRREFEKLLVAAQGSTREDRMHFLKAVQAPLAEWNAKAMPKVPMHQTPPSVAVNSHIDTRQCQSSIRQLHLQKNPVRHDISPEPANRSTHLLEESTASPRRTADAQQIASLQQQLTTERLHLNDLTRGYIWNIPQGEKMFHTDQRKDIFSDVFYLLGAAWELRIASEVTTTKSSTGSSHQPEPQDHLSVYLHCVNHQNRIDFRVSLFAADTWHTREAKGWSADFAGKGWGIRPFCSRRTILRDFVQDGQVKLCVAPIGELF